MDFSWTTEQEKSYQSVVEFAQTQLSDNIQLRDHDAEFSRQLWQRCADFGVLSWSVPRAHGGAGLPITTVTYLMEALGYGCRDNGLAFGLGAQMWSVQSALTHFGSPEQIQRYLGDSIQGKTLAAFAITERGSGSDAFALDTVAVRRGDDYILNGEKVLVTFAPIADYAIIFARTNPDNGQWGISAFIVDADTPGFNTEQNRQKMGLRTIPFGTINLSECCVSRHAMLGSEGAGASIFNFTQGRERSLVLAPQIGAMSYLMEQCIERARNRRRGGQAIASYSTVSHRIANMKIRLETARLLLYKTAWLLEEGRNNIMEASMTKSYISQAFVDSSNDAIAVFGGEGYCTDTEIERNLRDAIGATIYGGTTDIQKNIVARMLGL